MDWPPVPALGGQLPISRCALDRPPAVNPHREPGGSHESGLYLSNSIPANDLLRAGLIDALHIKLYPTVLGRGILSSTGGMIRPRTRLAH